MKPIIGITPEIAEDGKVSLNYAYTHAIEAAGGIPLVLPCTEDEGLLDRMAELCHGFAFSGGEDIEPARYGEEKIPQCGAPALRRDAFDFAMFRKALATGKPILGICRGGQLINVALGGTLVQDIPQEIPDLKVHDPIYKKEATHHPVVAEEGSLLHSLFGREFLTNSFHHQAIRDCGRDLVATVTSTDGVIEAVEHTSLPIIGVQWHPERMIHEIDQDYPNMLPLFEHFIDLCKK